MITILPLDFLSVWHRILERIKTLLGVYCLQISALVPEIIVFEKYVKYANEITDDIIYSTKYYLRNRKHVPCFYRVTET